MIMQRDLLTECHSSKLEFKNLQIKVRKDSCGPFHALQESYEYEKNFTLKSLHCKSEMPSVVSELAEINSALPICVKNVDSINKQLVLTNPLKLVDKSLEIGCKILNLNTGINQSLKESSTLTGRSVSYPLIGADNNNCPKNATKIESLSNKNLFSADLFNGKYPTAKSNGSANAKLPCTAVVCEPKENAPVQLQLNKDVNDCSESDSLPPNSNAKFRPKNDAVIEECIEVPETITNDSDLSSESEPLCVISEVVGNANDTFSGAFDVCSISTESTESQTVISRKAEDLKAEPNDSTTVVLVDSDPAVSDLKALEENEVEILETEAIASSKTREDQEFSKKTYGESALSGAADTPKPAEESETQLITPKKTNDITKIKGWRRKQFLVEKPTTVEFYRIEKGSKQRKIHVDDDSEPASPKTEKRGNIGNAFVCDSLDEFLDREVELKVSYEIPHLYAEIGIKLTSEDIASKPNLSDKDFKEVESRYCVRVQGKSDVVNLDEIDEECYKSGKRRSEDSKPSLKFLKLQDSKRQPALQKPAEKLKIEKKENVMIEGLQERLKGNATPVKVLDRTTENTDCVKLESKLLGLVVYPGPGQPLHPIVQNHLEKLRSYSTKIDKNWADFAASAVFSNDKHYKRRILPVHCCVKTEDLAKEVSKGGAVFEKELSAEGVNPDSTKYAKEKVKLKKCHVLIDKINIVEPLSPWCMEHNTYDCKPCGLSQKKFRHLESLMPQELPIERNTQNKHEDEVVNPQSSLDGKIANLLTRKLRALKFKGDTLTSIDCLKKLVPDTVEFIKLNFVKESFLSADISIWFQKQENPWTRSRAFLTFSETPPMPNVVNLKSHAFSVRDLPKVITEIISSDNVFSPNEYAILHCNGEIWEIHGSLNIAFGVKSDKNVEQIFASEHIPELKQLQEVAEKILKVRAVKWWVVDLSQKFKLIEIKFGNVISVVSRGKVLESARHDSHGFVPIRRNSKGRILGAYIIRPLLPFVLMGPYYLLETHNMTLKGERSTLPFMYFPKENVKKDCPLKFFINSVIKDVVENDKIPEGLWLYDKMGLDSTSYIEVLTRNLGCPLPSKFASIGVDHGYSLSSLTGCLPPGVTAGVVKRKDGQEELKRVTVYLYFDVIELGYVEGELQRDNSVIICHPLDRRTKVKSHKVGDWFVRTISRRIEFIPKDLEVKWFITKHREDLRERRPFNKFLLGGAHVLTKGGVFYLLEMSESKIAKLGLEKNEVVKAIMESQVIKVVLEMNKLADLLPCSGSDRSSMAKVLTRTISEIERLKSFGQCLKRERMKAEEEKLNSLSNFLQTLNSCQVNDQLKFKTIKSVELLFIKKNGELCEKFIAKLKKLRLGRKYLAWNGKSDLEKTVGNTKGDDSDSEAPKTIRNEKWKKLQFLLGSIKALGLPKVETLIKKSPIPDSRSLNNADVHIYEDLSEFPLSFAQEKTFTPATIQTDCTENISPEKRSSMEDLKGEKPKRKKAKRSKIVNKNSRSNSLAKGEEFLKLTSPGLPENIKLCWKNCKS